jgi:hypothetical protein
MRIYDENGAAVMGGGEDILKNIKIITYWGADNVYSKNNKL